MTIAETLSVWVYLCEIEHVERTRDRRFPIGTVVRRGDGKRGSATRGIVVRHGPYVIAAPGDIVVRVQAGVEHVSNDLEAWERVPLDEQTHEERVRSAALMYDARYDAESLAWGLLGALLPPRVWDRLCDGVGDWPDETDLAIEVARILDRRRP